MRHFFVFAINIALLFFGVACGNEGPTFSQGSAATRIALTVEAGDAVGEPPPGQEAAAPVLPSKDADPDGLEDLLEAFTDAEGDEAFDPDLYLPAEDQASDEAGAEPAPGESVATDPASTDSAPAPTPAATNPEPAADAQSTPTLPKNLEAPGVAELKLCGKLTGKPMVDIVVSQDAPIKSGSVVAIKVAGNEAAVELDLAGGENSSLQGLCVFVTGNKSTFDAALSLNVKNLIVIARGNATASSFSLTKGLGAGAVSISGNASKVDVQLNGSANCASIFVHGASKAGFSCN